MSEPGLIGRRKYDTLPVFEAEYGCGATTTALMVNPDLVLSDVDTEFAIAGERGEEGPCRVILVFVVLFCFVQ